MEWHGLGLDYLQRYNDIVYSITPKDVQRVASTYLRSEACLAVVAGPAVEQEIMIRTGLDLVEIERVQASVDRFGDRFLAPHLHATPNWRSATAGPVRWRRASPPRRPSPKRSARASGAPASIGPTSKSSTTRSHENRTWCLHGAAAERAGELSAYSEWSVSLTHARESAVAFTVAIGNHVRCLTRDAASALRVRPDCHHSRQSCRRPSDIVRPSWGSGSPHVGKSSAPSKAPTGGTVSWNPAQEWMCILKSSAELPGRAAGPPAPRASLRRAGRSSPCPSSTAALAYLEWLRSELRPLAHTPYAGRTQLAASPLRRRQHIQYLARQFITTKARHQVDALYMG